MSKRTAHNKSIRKDVSMAAPMSDWNIDILMVLESRCTHDFIRSYYFHTQSQSAIRISGERCYTPKTQSEPRGARL